MQINLCIIYVCVCACVLVRIYGCMYVFMYVCMRARLDGLMAGWADRWMDVKIDELDNRYLHAHNCIYAYEDAKAWGTGL